MTKTLADLEAAAQAAQKRHESAQQAAAEARRREEDARAERLAAHDQHVLDNYSDEQLAEQVRDAQQELDQAVSKSTLGSAWLRLKVLQIRRAHASVEAAAAAARIGDGRTILPRVAGGAAFEELGRAVDRVAERQVADELDARDDERTAAGDG